MVITSSEDFRVTTVILRMPGYITSTLEDIYAFHMCQILRGIHRLTSSYQLLLTRNQQLLGHSRISHEPCVPTKHFLWRVSFLFNTQDHRFCSPASLETKQSLWLCQRCSAWVAKLQKVHLLVSRGPGDLPLTSVSPPLVKWKVWTKSACEYLPIRAVGLISCNIFLFPKDLHNKFTLMFTLVSLCDIDRAYWSF